MRTLSTKYPVKKLYCKSLESSKTLERRQCYHSEAIVQYVYLGFISRVITDFVCTVNRSALRDVLPDAAGIML